MRSLGQKMFSFLRKKADPPVTISPDPIKGNFFEYFIFVLNSFIVRFSHTVDDYVLVGSSTPQLPHYPPLNPPATSGNLYPGVPYVDRRNSDPSPITRQDSVSTKHTFAIDGVPFKLASNVQSQDAFTESVRQQMDGLRRHIDAFQATDKSLNYDFRTEKSVISGY